MALIKLLTPPTLAGLFFCIASAEGAGLLFCPAAIQPHTSVYSVFYSIHAVIPPTPQNSAALPAHTRYQRHAGRCTGQHSRPIIIMYIKARVRPCCGSMPARRGQLLPSVDCWQVLAACQQYRPGAPAEGSASPPVQGQPGTLHPAGQSSSRARRAARSH